MVRVWDLLVRVCHWTLVTAVVLGWLTQKGWGLWHEAVGYAALAVLAVRIAWGWLGPREARFAGFVRSTAATRRYAMQILARREPRYLGHNPLGGWMIVALLINVTLVCLSGWLFTTDRYWGVEWVEDLHEALSDSLLALVAMHLCGVAYTSWHHGENLVAAMIHGRKRPLQD